jgi:hypothetical protein
MSIFSRSRELPPPPPIGGSGAISAKQPRAPYFVGAMKDDDGVAGVLEFLDEKGASTVVKIHAGDPIIWQDAHVESITLDALVISTRSGTREIPLGADLNRQPLPASPATPASTPTVGIRGPRTPRTPAFNPAQQRPRQRGGSGNEPLAE